jgi:hypothetical protein
MWILAIWVYLCFIFNRPAYDALRAMGATCYVYLSDHGESPATPPPPCFYNEE